MQHKQQIIKKLTSILLFILCCNCSKAQYNLVLNYSFENYTICPTKMNAPPPSPWYFAGTYIPLCYYNNCTADTFRSVPENYIKRKNFQFARTGNAYIYLDYQNGGDRQYMQIKLTDSLQKNKYYYAEHFVNIPNGLRFSCNNLGMLFTKTALYVDTVAEKYGVLLANPQVVNYGNPALGDTVNWIKVSGVFKAQGGEQYLTLGNFKQDSNTILKQIQPTGSYSAGYVIDDVSIIPLDSFCLKADAGRDTTIAVGDSVFIGSYTNGIDTLMWLENGTIKKDSTRPGFWVKPTITGTSFYILQQTVNGCFSADTIYINAVLPLNFINYNVTIPLLGGVRGGLVQNIWTTTNEINVSYYNIQRSTNNKDFTTIGTVKAKNKSSNQYTFYDSPPVEGLGVVFYRIGAVDNDGKKTYSQIKKISTVNYQLSTINVYPNPAKDYINITSQQNIKEIKIINQLGQTLQQFDNLNTKQQIINTEHFARGIYMFQIITSNGEIKTQKIFFVK